MTFAWDWDPQRDIVSLWLLYVLLCYLGLSAWAGIACWLIERRLR